VIERVYGALLHFVRICGGASEGATVFEREGVVAAVAPAVPERSVVNSVAYRSADELEAAYDDIAAAYAEIGAKWTVWVRPDDERAARFLESRGHVDDAQPVAMAHDLQGVERPPADALPDWTAEGDLAVIGPLNDRAYGLDTDSFTRALTMLPGGATRIYVARDEGEPVGCLVMTDHDGNSDVEMVAVVPEARGRGISGNLLLHALADAAERGCETSTLVSTVMGYKVYERVGFRPYGQIHMWELRPGA
jgi:ribosomal protein S18 acetylase RimI-like enzyme